MTELSRWNAALDQANSIGFNPLQVVRMWGVRKRIYTWLARAAQRGGTA